MIDLKVKLELHLKWLRDEADGERANLSWANLSGADLSGANLSRADLSGANLSMADLSMANLFVAKGILSFNGEKNLAFAFEFDSKLYIKIGCILKLAVEWIEQFNTIGKKNNYSELDIKRYGAFIKLVLETWK